MLTWQDLCKTPSSRISYRLQTSWVASSLSGTRLQMNLWYSVHGKSLEIPQARGIDCIRKPPGISYGYLGITHCHYDGILTINLHSFSVKACVHLSTNFTSLNILGYVLPGGAGGTPYVSHTPLVLKCVYREWGMDFEGTTGEYEHIYCYSSKLVRKKERVMFEFKATFCDFFQFSMTLGKAVI